MTLFPSSPVVISMQHPVPQVALTLTLTLTRTLTLGN